MDGIKIDWRSVFFYGFVLSLQTPNTSDSLTPLNSIRPFMVKCFMFLFFCVPLSFPFIFLVFSKSFNTLHKSLGETPWVGSSESPLLIESNVIEIPNLFKADNNAVFFKGKLIPEHFGLVSSTLSYPITDPRIYVVFTYMNGWFLWLNVGKYTSPMDPMGIGSL